MILIKLGIVDLKDIELKNFKIIQIFISRIVFEFNIREQKNKVADVKTSLFLKGKLFFDVKLQQIIHKSYLALNEFDLIKLFFINIQKNKRDAY